MLSFTRVFMMVVVIGCVGIPVFAGPHRKTGSHASQASLDRNYARDYNLMGQQLKSMSPQILAKSHYMPKYQDVFAEKLVSGTSRAEAREAARRGYEMFVAVRKIHFSEKRARSCLVIIGGSSDQLLASCDQHGVR